MFRFCVDGDHILVVVFINDFFLCFEQILLKNLIISQLQLPHFHSCIILPFVSYNRLFWDNLCLFLIDRSLSFGTIFFREG